MSELPAYPLTRTEGRPMDLPPGYADWIAQDGLARATWNDCPVWVVSRHADVEQAMTDPRVSAEVRGRLLAQSMEDAALIPPTFPRMDAPEHGRLRRMLVRDFTAKRAQAMRAHIRSVADDFLDRMVEKGPPADLVRDYALPIPSLVICLLLGVPYRDHEFFQRHSSTAFNLHATRQEQLEASAALFGYMIDLVETKRREPGDDVMTRLVADHVERGDLSVEGAAMNGMILLNAGHETTANMIALGLLALLQNPDQAARVRDADEGPALTGAVDELMRYLSIVQGFVIRIAREELTLGGQVVAPGDAMLMNLPAANRDPARFPDPDALDVGRQARGHVAFGHGVHQCLGQSLARVELEVAYTAALRRFPDLRVAVPLEEIRFRDDMGTYGVHELPVAW